MTPGSPESLPPEILRNLVVGPGAVVARDQPDVELPAMAVAAAAEATARAAPAVCDDIRGLGHRLPDHLLELQHDRFRALDAGADGQLGVDVDLALVGLRHQFHADHREQHHRRHHERRRSGDDRRTVRQRHVDDLPIAVVHPLQRALARTIEAGHDAGGLGLFLRRVQPA